MLTVGSLFAGIGGFDLGFHRAGHRCLWQVEIDEAARGVLARHFPDAERFADVRDVGAHNLAAVDIITFGSPCQDLSVAGRRAGLDGERSGLFFEAVRIIDELRPTYAVWENVPGALSSNGGRDFGAALDALADAGAVDIGWAVLDAQWFGVAQRRRRVFLVASFGGGASTAEILSLGEGGEWHPPARGEAGQGVAASLMRGSASGSGVNQPGRRREDDVNLVAATLRVPSNGATWRGDGCDNLVPSVASTLGSRGTRSHTELDGHGAYIPEIHDTLNAQYGKGIAGHNRERNDVALPIPFTNRAIEGDTFETLIAASHGALPMVAHSLTAEGHDASEDGTGRGTPLVPTYGIRGTLTSRSADKGGPGGTGVTTDGSQWTLTAVETHAVAHGMAVRRLTPTECERLQGFPEVEESVIIHVWKKCYPDQQKSDVPAEIRSPKLPKSALSADAAGFNASAPSAANPFWQNHPDHAKPVALAVRIDCERGVVQIRSPEKLLLHASSAESSAWSALSMRPADFVRLGVAISTILARTTLDGKAASPPSSVHSGVLRRGSHVVRLCGNEIAAHASGVAVGTEAETRPTKSITSAVGSSSPNSDSTLATLLSSVIRAISGFIPSTTQADNSYAVSLTLVSGWTAFDAEGKPQSDSARYRQLGNAVCVNVSEWIAGRIGAA